jgi:hypothetical protein
VLLGSTAVIRLKSPLAHVSYSSGSKVRPPDQYGEELADAKFCICTLPPAAQAHCAQEIQMGPKSGHKGLHNVRAICASESNWKASSRLSPAVPNLLLKPVDEVAHRAVFGTTPV